MHGATTKMSNLVYKLTKRGLCSLLNSIIGLYEEQLLGDKKTIYIDPFRSTYFKINNFFDVFLANEVIINSVTGNEVPISEKHARKFSIKGYQPSIKSILNYTTEFHKEIESVVSELNLPKSFACFHIRRGDKVGEKLYEWTQKTGRTESKRFEFCDYLKHCKNIETIFIMTDDYRCIQEAREYINDNKLPHKILHLTNESQGGHSETLDIQNDRVYSKKELVQFFSEIEIAKLSDFFVGTRTSNVYRYIKNTCTTNTKFVSLD
jgi:hypothetical protein